MVKAKKWYKNLLKILLPLLILVLICCALSSCDTINSDDILNKLLPNFTIIIVHLIAVAILLFFIVRFGWKPTQKILKSRNKLIQDNIDDSIQKEKEAIKKSIEAEQILFDSKINAELLINKSKMEAEEYRIHTIERANIDAEEIKLQAQSDIDLIKKQLYINSVNDIVDTAVVISKSIIGDKITKKDNDKLFDMALKNINMSNGTNE